MKGREIFEAPTLYASWDLLQVEHLAEGLTFNKFLQSSVIPETQKQHIVREVVDFLNFETSKHATIRSGAKEEHLLLSDPNAGNFIITPEGKVSVLDRRKFLKRTETQLEALHALDGTEANAQAEFFKNFILGLCEDYNTSVPREEQLTAEDQILVARRALDAVIRTLGNEEADMQPFYQEVQEIQEKRRAAKKTQTLFGRLQGQYARLRDFAQKQNMSLVKAAITGRKMGHLVPQLEQLEAMGEVIAKRLQERPEITEVELLQSIAEEMESPIDSNDRAIPITIDTHLSLRNRKLKQELANRYLTHD
jgi:hypothetical protein